MVIQGVFFTVLQVLYPVFQVLRSVGQVLHSVLSITSITPGIISITLGITGMTRYYRYYSNNNSGRVRVLQGVIPPRQFRFAATIFAFLNPLWKNPRFNFDQECVYLLPVARMGGGYRTTTISRLVVSLMLSPSLWMVIVMLSLTNVATQSPFSRGLTFYVYMLPGYVA